MSIATAFPRRLRIERIAPMRGFLIEPFVFLSPSLGEIEAPAGFVTDYASIPRALWSLYPPDGAYTEAAVIHDWLYASHVGPDGEPITRSQADEVFDEALRECGIPAARRRIFVTAVQRFGEGPWRRARPADLPPLPPTPRRPIRRGPRR